MKTACRCLFLIVFLLFRNHDRRRKDEYHAYGNARQRTETSAGCRRIGAFLRFLARRISEREFVGLKLAERIRYGVIHFNRSFLGEREELRVLIERRVAFYNEVSDLFARNFE